MNGNNIPLTNLKALGTRNLNLESERAEVVLALQEDIDNVYDGNISAGLTFFVYLDSENKLVIISNVENEVPANLAGSNGIIFSSLGFETGE